MGNLFVCEMETPEDKENAPLWSLTGTELLDDHQAPVIETEGNTAVPVALARMNKGMARGSTGNGARQPVVKVSESFSKHWISKSDYRHLQAAQKSKVQIAMDLPDGNQQLIENSSKASSKYSYDRVNIEIPGEARNILSPGTPSW